MEEWHYLSSMRVKTTFHINYVHKVHLGLNMYHLQYTFMSGLDISVLDQKYFCEDNLYRFLFILIYV